MYCTECGKPGSGKFCGHCGTALGADDARPETPTDWSNEHRYAVLTGVPEIRERIALCAARAKTAMTAEEFLQAGDKLLAPLVSGIPISRLIAVVQPIYARLGIKTGKRREQVFSKPIGEMMAATLCALAAAGLRIRAVQQADDGCHLEAVLPSDVFSFTDDVLVDLTRHAPGTRLVLATNVPGQLYDWGKSDRCLNALLREIESSIDDASHGESKAA